MNKSDHITALNNLQKYLIDIRNSEGKSGRIIITPDTIELVGVITHATDKIVELLDIMTGKQNES